MAVNKPRPWTQSVYCHKFLALCYNYYIMAQEMAQLYHIVIAWSPCSCITKLSLHFSLHWKMFLSSTTCPQTPGFLVHGTCHSATFPSSALTCTILKYMSLALCRMLHGSIVWGVSVVKRGGGDPIDKTSLRPCLVVSAPSAGVSNICETTNVPLLVQNEECVHKMRSFDQGPLPPLST